MGSFFTHLFDTSDFPPRWHCGHWTAGHGWLHILSDLGVWSAYVAIPCVLGYFLLRRRDIPFRLIFVLFAAFILACGSTHLMEAILFWWPAYRFGGLLKLFTAIVSWSTVIALVPVAPKVLAMRSSAALEREVAERQKAEDALQVAFDELEVRVRERTADLARANATLHAEIEERKRIEEDLREQREQLRITLASIGDGVIVTDLRGRITLLNPLAQALTGWDHEALGKPLDEVFVLVQDETGLPMKNPVDQILWQDEPVVPDISYPLLVARDRTARPIESSAALLERAEDRIGAVLVFRDISERLRDEDALLESERRLRRLSEFQQAVMANLGEGLYTVDLHGLVTYMNPAAESAFGWTSIELLGCNMHAMTHFKHPDGSPFPREECAGWKVLQQGTVLKDHDDVFIRKDGTFFPVVYTSSPLISEGAIRGLVLVFHDVTDRKRAEEALRQSEDRFRNAFDHAPNGMWLAGLDGRWLKVNRALCEIVGRTEEEMLATTLQAIAHPADIEAERDNVRKLLAGEVSHYRMEMRYLHRLGHEVWILQSGALVRDARGAPLTFVGHVHDITERKEAERKVRASLEEKEVLLKEVHHRVKNNLQVISSLLHLQSQFSHDAESIQMFRESQHRVRSMALVHERLYRSKDLARVDFREYIESLANSLFRSYHVDVDRIELVVDIGEVRMAIDTAVPCGLLINELVSNCLKHAFKGRAGGQIHIELRPLSPDEILLRISDDGVGLPASVTPQTAETFGMQLVADLADQLHARIDIQRENGTAFRILFPAAT